MYCIAKDQHRAVSAGKRLEGQSISNAETGYGSVLNCHVQAMKRFVPERMRKELLRQGQAMQRKCVALGSKGSEVHSNAP